MDEHGLNEAGLLRAIEASGRSIAGMELTRSFIFNVLASRSPDASEVAAFVEAAVTAPAPIGPAALEAFQEDVSMTESVASKLWLKASDGDVDDWREVLCGLDVLADVARRHSLTALAVSVERTRAVVLYEEVEDREAAEDALAEAAERLGDPPRLREYRGKILRMEGEFGEALAFYEELLPKWDEKDPNTSRLYAYHDVIEAAGTVGAWDRAAHWADEAMHAAQKLSSVSDAFVESCYAVDGAFAEFKADRICDAIVRLRDVVMRLPDPSEPRSRMLHRRVAHVTAWIHGEVGGLRATGMKEPSPGMASRFDSDSEGSDVPVLERNALLSVLRQSAVLAGCGALEVNLSPEEGESLLSRSMQIHRTLTDGIQMAAPDLPNLYIETIEAAERTVAEQKGEVPSLSPPDPNGTLVALSYGAISLIAQDPVRLEVLDTWTNHMRELFGYREEVDQWWNVVEIARAVMNGVSRKIAELALILPSGTAPPNHRLIAAAALAKASRDPDTRAQALALLAASASVHPFGMGVGAALAALAGSDVPPGQGVRAAAQSVLDYPRFEALRLAPQMVAALHTAVNGGPQWGLGSG
jgi:tetratricopeptide (TPR) repeat protein